MLSLLPPFATMFQKPKILHKFCIKDAHIDKFKVCCICCSVFAVVSLYLELYSLAWSWDQCSLNMLLVLTKGISIVLGSDWQLWSKVWENFLFELFWKGLARMLRKLVLIVLKRSGSNPANCSFLIFSNFLIWPLFQ